MKLPLLFPAFLLVTGCATGLGEATDGSKSQSGDTADLPPATVDAPSHAAVAAASLKTLAQLVTPQKMLGFHSMSEAASASLANPLPMLMVQLNDLQAYRTGDDPRPLLKSEGSFIYPVTVEGDVRSSVVVRKAGSAWKATQFGRANLAKFAQEERQQVSLARRVPESDVSLVEIPTMSARMLEHDENGVPMLTALLDVPGTDVRAGTTVPAADVFAKLHPLAMLNDGTKPN